MSEEHQRLRSVLREYFSELVTPERRAALAATTGEFGDVEAYRSLIRQLDNFRRRVDKQRRKIAQAEESRGLGRLRSGAARRLRRRRS